MQKIMLLASRDEREAAKKVFAELIELNYEVLRPRESDWQDLEKSAQVDFLSCWAVRRAQLSRWPVL